MRRVVIKGGHVVSMDAALGELAGADILVEDDEAVFSTRDDLIALVRCWPKRIPLADVCHFGYEQTSRYKRSGSPMT